MEAIAAPLLAVPVANLTSIRAACVAMSAYLEASSDSSSELSNVKFEAEALSVKIWNASVKAKSSSSGAVCKETIARLRGVALQLGEFGLSAVGQTVDVRRRLLSLAVNAGKAFVDLGDDESADAAFERAAKFAVNESDEEEGQNAVAALAQDSALLFCFQAELIWRTNKDDVAFLLVNRACSLRLLRHLSVREIDGIVASCLEMAKGAGHCFASVEWLKCALKLFENVVVEGDRLKQRRIEVLLNLATEYLFLQNHEQADTISTQLLQNTSGLTALACIQIKLKILQQRNISDPKEYLHICNTLQKTVSMVNAKPELIDLFLSILHSVAPVSVSCAITLADWLIAQNANIPDKVSLFEKVFLTKIHLLTAAGSSILKEDAIRHVKEVIQNVGGSKGGSVSKDTARMAQLVVWKCGENAMLQHLFEDAVDWFLVALRLVTGENGDDRNVAILYRKLALSYVQLKRFPEALDACNKASLFKNDVNPMATIYIRFLIYLEQGMTELAESTMLEMAEHLRQSGDKDKVLSFLLGAMDRSFKCGNQLLLKKILQTLLLYNEFEDVEFWRRTMLVVVRCLIRLSVATDVGELGKEQYEEILKYAATIIKSITSWKNDTKDAVSPVPELEAEISWIGKTCWNLGLKSCSGFPIISSKFFSFAAQAMRLEAENNPETLTTRKICIYIALFGEIELARESGQGGADHVKRARAHFDDLSQVYIDLANLDSMTSPKDHVYYKVIVLEYELILLEYSVLSMNLATVFESIKCCIARATDEDFPLESFQRMADLAVSTNAPSNIVFLTVHTALGVMMKKQSDLNLVQFAQWFRLMVSSGQVDGPKVELYKQAVMIIKSTGSKSLYPSEEIQCAGDKTNAVLWCEMAFKLAEFLPLDCTDQIEEMRQSYADILSED
ncbi:UNVERIFIED_CONTAM: Testis-expressed protein 11 [Siphonaria sp. JEL0065]|nr:Testis-expressed protein 11 [Siphonaria sp. JEL0065]